MSGDNYIWIWVAVAGFIALLFAFFLLRLAFWGASALFAYAIEQGFVGLIAYIAAWVFLFPLMLVASIGVGVFGMWAIRYIKKQDNLDGRRNQRVPPNGSVEHYRWANRLPPYDKE